MLCNIQGNSVIKVKHYLSLFIGLVLYFAISLPVFAIDENIAVDNSEQTQSIVDILEFIEPDKDKYGMSSVDFTNLYVGEPMEVYNYTTEGFVPVDLFLPILYDGKLAAVLSDLRGSGIFSIQNALVEPIASNVNINDEFALVFDKQNCYLFDGSNWILLKTYSYPNDNNTILDTNNAKNVSVIEMNTLGNATPLEYNSVVTRGYNSEKGLVYECDIDVVLQTTDNICWAACGACISNFINGTSYTAIDVAKIYQEYIGASEYDVGLKIGDTTKLYDALDLGNYKQNTEPSGYWIAINVAKQYPVHAVFRVSNNTNHAYVIYSIDVDYTTIKLMDPEEGFVVGKADGDKFILEYGTNIRTIRSSFAPLIE